MRAIACVRVRAVCVCVSKRKKRTRANQTGRVTIEGKAKFKFEKSNARTEESARERVEEEWARENGEGHDKKESEKREA